MRLLFFLFVVLNSTTFDTFAQNAEDATPLETSKTFGNYEIFFNAIPSTTLLPDMAAAYRIERSNDLAYISITVFKKTGKDSAMRAATLKGTYTDLITVKPLAFREMREHDSVNYIAQVPYHNREVLRFDIEVQPQLQANEIAPIGSPFKISFMRKFYTEP